MTPEQIARVGSIIERVDATALADRFYVRLFEAAPSTAAMFPDPAAQSLKLRDELASMVELLADLPTLDERARDLGERHRGYGVRASHYRVAREVLAATLVEVMGDEMSSEDREAWDRATALITELMQSV